MKTDRIIRYYLVMNRYYQNMCLYVWISTSLYDWRILFLHSVHQKYFYNNNSLTIACYLMFVQSRDQTWLWRDNCKDNQEIRTRIDRLLASQTRMKMWYSQYYNRNPKSGNISLWLVLFVRFAVLYLFRFRRASKTLKTKSSHDSNSAVNVNSGGSNSVVNVNSGGCRLYNLQCHQY